MEVRRWSITAMECSVRDTPWLITVNSRIISAGLTETLCSWNSWNSFFCCFLACRRAIAQCRSLSRGAHTWKWLLKRKTVSWETAVFQSMKRRRCQIRADSWRAARAGHTSHLKSHDDRFLEREWVFIYGLIQHALQPESSNSLPRPAWS